MKTVGMIFAAGVGSRLKPFTDSHPKALVEVCGCPMLQRVIESMARAGISRIIVNVHHFAPQIVDFLRDNNNFGLDIAVSDESGRLLETGGGLLKALPLIGDADSVLLHNADIMTDIDLGRLIDAHSDRGADVTLWVKQRESSRQLYFDGQMRLQGWENLSSRQTKPEGFVPRADMVMRAFSGVQVVSSSVFDPLRDYGRQNDAFSIIPFYLSQLQSLDIAGFDVDATWFDVGRPESLEAARRHCASTAR